MWREKKRQVDRGRVQKYAGYTMLSSGTYVHVGTAGGGGEGGEGRACRETESESRNGIHMREKRFRRAGARGKT